MDASILKDVKDIGIAGLSVIAFAYLLYTFLKYAFESLKKTQEEHRADQVWFQEFVEINNHQKSDMIREHTKVMVEVGKGLEVHTKAVEKLIEKMEKHL